MANQVTRTTDKTPADAPETTYGGRIYRPITDIVETGDGVTLMMEMPGVAAEDVDVTLEKRVLTIQGKVRPTSIDRLDLAYAEYGEGDFERVFTMSDDFDPEKIEAEVQNGVLTLRLPRAAAAQPRKITVKAA
jgi:HSP20 family molecular chaperone IbpA